MLEAWGVCFSLFFFFFWKGIYFHVSQTQSHYPALHGAGFDWARKVAIKADEGSETERRLGRKQREFFIFLSASPLNCAPDKTAMLRRQDPYAGTRTTQKGLQSRQVVSLLAVSLPSPAFRATMYTRPKPPCYKCTQATEPCTIKFQLSESLKTNMQISSKPVSWHIWS